MQSLKEQEMEATEVSGEKGLRFPAYLIQVQRIVLLPGVSGGAAVRVTGRA